MQIFTGSFLVVVISGAVVFGGARLLSLLLSRIIVTTMAVPIVWLAQLGQVFIFNILNIWYNGFSERKMEITHKS